MSSAEGMCSAVYHRSGLSKAWLELCVSAQCLEQLGNDGMLLGLGFRGTAPTRFQPLQPHG